jgi:hypothetical protein
MSDTFFGRLWLFLDFLIVTLKSPQSSYLKSSTGDFEVLKLVRDTGFEPGLAMTVPKAPIHCHQFELGASIRSRLVMNRPLAYRPP